MKTSSNQDLPRRSDAGEDSSSKKIVILLLGGAQRVSLAQFLKKSGESLNHQVEIISYDFSLEVPIALEARVIKGLSWSDPAAVDDIVATAEKYHVDIILPMVNEAIKVAAQSKERLPDVFIPVSGEEIATALSDKTQAAKIFKEAKFPIPKTYTVLSAIMPAIAKPRKGGSSKGIKIFHDMEDLMHLHNLQDYIVQEYIGHNKEYTVDAYIDKQGEIITIVPRERLEIIGGESVRTVTCRNPEIEDFSIKVIERFNLRGPVNLQFLHDLDNDRFLLMEVNPRLAGAVICSILAGAPVTDFIIREALNLPLKPCNDWKEDTLLARYFKEAVFYN